MNDLLHRADAHDENPLAIETASEANAAPPNASRDRYLDAAAGKLSSLLTAHGHTLPPIRCSTSSTSGGRRSTARSETYPPDASRGGWAEVQIVPGLETPFAVVIQLLVCLVIQAAGFSRGHAKRCRAIAAQIGLEWSLRSPELSEELTNRLNAIVGELGDYPHRLLDVNYGRHTPQSTRLLVARFPSCAYRIYITRKHALTGVPGCASHPELGPFIMAVSLGGDAASAGPAGIEQPTARSAGTHGITAEHRDSEADADPCHDGLINDVVAEPEDTTPLVTSTDTDTDATGGPPTPSRERTGHDLEKDPLVDRPMMADVGQAVAPKVGSRSKSKVQATRRSDIEPVENTGSSRRHRPDKGRVDLFRNPSLDVNASPASEAQHHPPPSHQADGS